MKKTTQKVIRILIKLGVAERLNECSRELHDKLHRVAISTGVYGLNGLVLEHEDTGKLYAIPERNSTLNYYAL